MEYRIDWKGQGVHLSWEVQEKRLVRNLAAIDTRVKNVWVPVARFAEHKHAVGFIDSLPADDWRDGKVWHGGDIWVDE